MTASQAYQRLFDLLFCVTLAAGIFVRWPSETAPFLWYAEAWRAFGAIASHDGQLLQLSELFLGRLGVATLGHTSLALRIWPLLFSVAALIGIYALGRRARLASAGVCAALLVALGPGFVFHAREFKPFAMDLAFTVWSMWLAVRWAESKSRSAWIGLTTMLVTFAASSIVFVFVYPAILFYVWTSSQREQRGGVALLAVPAIVFLLVYGLYLRPQITAGGTIGYWSNYYTGSWAALQRIATGARFELAWFLVPGWKAAVAAYFIALPLLAIFARDRLALLLLLPVLVQAAFATAGMYPLFGPPSHYLYGLMAIALPYSIAALLARVTEPQSAGSKLADLGLMAAAALVIATSGRFTTELAEARAWPVEQGRDAFEMLGARIGDDDRAFVSYSAYYTYRFHSLGDASTAQTLRSYSIETDSFETALRDNSMGGLCRSIKQHVRTGKKASRLWFVSTDVPHAHVFYRELLRPITDFELVLGDKKQSLARVTLKKNLSRLTCP